MTVFAGALALVAVGATPASAASSCPPTTPAYFSTPLIYVGRESADSSIWSSDVTMYAFCGAPDTPLAGVLVTEVTAASSGVVSDLEASANGDAPTTPLPIVRPPHVDGVDLTVKNAAHPGGIWTDDTGHATFKLRVQSRSGADLAAGGAPRLIGMHLEYGMAPIDTGASDPGWVIGGGGIFAATPELDSLVLFGSGAAGLASYSLLRLRARRGR